MTTTTAYKTWLARIESGIFTKAQCNQFAHAAARLADDLPAAGKSTNLTPAEASDLVGRLKARGVALTPEHARQGIEWLRQYGEKRLDLPLRHVEQFSHFTYNGEAAHGRFSSVPVWQMHLLDGRTIRYYVTAWQTGQYGGASDFSWWIDSQPAVC